MTFRKAVAADLNAVVKIYKDAIEVMDSLGIHQWDAVYPSAETLRQDIENGSMYLGLMDQCIVSIFVLDPQCDELYGDGDWRHPSLPFSVVHRLCVNPACQGTGVATQTMRHIEGVLRDEGIAVIRLDAYSKNPAALRLYEKLGYVKVGEVPFRKGIFFLFEKKL